MLEKLDSENQQKDKMKFVRYEEFNQIQDGQVMVSIEHWYELLISIIMAIV